MALVDGAGFQEWLAAVCRVLEGDYETTILSGDLGLFFRWSEGDVQKKYSSARLIRKIKYYKIFGDWYIPSPKSWVDIYREFKKNDYIYLNHSYRMHDPVPKILAIFSRSRVVLGAHSPFKESISKKTYFWFFSKLFLKRFSCVHVLNTDSADLMKKSGASKVVVVPNFLVQSKLPETIKASFDGGFVFAGRDEEQKGVDLVTSAIRRVLPSYPKATFYFFGSGKEKLPIRKLQRDFPKNVFDLGYEPDKDKMFSGKKYLILSSGREPFGLVVIEAMSYGLPVVVTKTSGPKDIVEEGKDGVFADSITVEGIEQAILKALSIERVVYEKMSKNAFQKAHEKYTKEVFLKNFKKMLEELR